MNLSLPHYCLYSEAAEGDRPGRWRFVLRDPEGVPRLAESDAEPDVHGERLELLSVVRALEALEEPSRVTLMTPSVYVREGIRYGLEEWRRNDWRWESFGRMVPVKHADLWRRVDRAMQFHEVQCVTLRLDAAHHAEGTSTMQETEPLWPRWRFRLLRRWVRWRHRVSTGLSDLAQAAAVCLS